MIVDSDLDCTMNGVSWEGMIRGVWPMMRFFHKNGLSLKVQELLKHCWCCHREDPQEPLNVFRNPKKRSNASGIALWTAMHFGKLYRLPAMAWQSCDASVPNRKRKVALGVSKSEKAG
jgi:hypothetical protein